MAKKIKPVIGWREWVAFPKFQQTAIKAKVDTGAKTSSLHAFDIKIIQRKGKTRARFKIYPLQDTTETFVVIEAPLVEHRFVKSSSGHREDRPVVITEINLMGQTWPIEITLTNRDLMGFRMLLGRRAIRGKFLVDAARSFLATKQRQSIEEQL